MSTYTSLFTIRIEHDFFVDGSHPALDFLPTSQTVAAIDNTELILRNNRDGIGVFFDADRSDSLRLYLADPDEPLCLSFKVFAADPHFANYTLPPLQGGSLLYFDSRIAVEENTGALRLHKAQYASETQRESLPPKDPTDPPHQLADWLDRGELLAPPAFAVNIRISPEWMTGGGSRTCVIRFKSRPTFWKYYLLGEMARANTYIADLNEEAQFATAGEEALADGRLAWVLRSKKALPLQNRPRYHLQLREKNGDNDRGKILVRRLPVASASQIHREKIGGKDAFVSEMYVRVTEKK